MNDLEEDGILNFYKEKDNSKYYKLTIQSENLLVTIPRDLEEIFIRFKSFVDTVNKISLKETEIQTKIKNSKVSNSDNKSYDQSLLLLPYNLIDLINDIFTFYFLFILPKKIEDNSICIKLYTCYFENMIKMYSYISKKLNPIFPTSIGNFLPMSSNPYENYLESKKYYNFEKVCYVSYLCMIFDIEGNLYEVLDFLWIRYLESVSLMYESDIDYMLGMDENHINFMYNLNEDYIQKLKGINKHYAYNNDMLNKIHNGVNHYILYDKRRDTEGDRFVTRGSGH